MDQNKRRIFSIKTVSDITSVMTDYLLGFSTVQQLTTNIIPIEEINYALANSFFDYLPEDLSVTERPGLVVLELYYRGVVSITLSLCERPLTQRESQILAIAEQLQHIIDPALILPSQRQHIAFINKTVSAAREVEASQRRANRNMQ